MAIFLIGLKAWASIETSSMAMLGSLADSGLDLLASLVVLMGVRVAAQPADSDHRFGHGKAEALASLVQVILITLSALFIGYRSVIRLIAGERTQAAESGLASRSSRSRSPSHSSRISDTSLSGLARSPSRPTGFTMRPT